MEYIQIKTLIDITKTDIRRPNQGNQLEFDQHKNFTTLLQCLEIKSIVHFNNPPNVEKVDIKNLGFGILYKGKHRVWTFKFTPDRPLVYQDDVNEIGLLLNDLHQVPIIKNLSETINIDTAIFNLHDSQFKNTVIETF
jgi:hypothetical protein